MSMDTKMKNQSGKITSSRRLGFTLIELLVVVAIIAVLVSMLLPSLSVARETAKQAICVSDQRQIGLAMAMYADSYNGFLVPSVDYEGSAERGLDGLVWYDRLYNDNLLQFDYNDPRVLHCPSDDKVRKAKFASNVHQYVSYATNRYTNGFFVTTRDDWKVRKQDSFTRSPSTIIILGERGSISEPITKPWSIVGTNMYWWSGVIAGVGCGTDWTRHSPNYYWDPKTRGVYNGAAGFLLADGSAKMYKGVAFGWTSISPGFVEAIGPVPGAPYPVLQPND